MADVTELSKELGVTPQGLRKQIHGWKRSIKEFRDLGYLGRRPPSVTLTEFIENLKVYGGADLQEIFNRLINAKRHIEKYGIRAVEFYPQILTRGGHLRSLLSSIPSHQQEESKARLIFETQLAYVVECTELFVTEVIHRKGRIYQSMNARRQKVE